MKKFAFAALLSLGMSSAALAKSQVIVLPPDFPGSKEGLIDIIGKAAEALKPSDRLMVYAARPTVRQLADIQIPNSPNAENRAWVKRKLGEQAAPALSYITELPGASSTEPPGNLMVPDLLGELARNVIPALPEKGADVLVIGSLIYFDPRDSRWAMTDRFYPSDGLLRSDPGKVPYGVAGQQARLKGVTVHFCTPEGKTQFVSNEHEVAVKRFFSIWITEQSGRVATFSDDLATCARRFAAGDASGQPTYQPKRDAKPEMLRARLPVPNALPASMERPGAYFLRDDVPISRTPPNRTTGIAWIGLKWKAPCDVDLYARPDKNSAWLFFGNVRSDKGFFNKDWLGATDEGQFEFVEFNKPIDLNNTEAAINLYSGLLPASPEGVVRVWFDGKVYEAPFKLEARAGNHGARPMSGQNWVTVNLRKLVGLPEVQTPRDRQTERAAR